MVMGDLGLLAVTSHLAWHFLQDKVAKSAVEALKSLYGTSYKYGSIITTICKCARSRWVVLGGSPVDFSCLRECLSQRK